ncbi:sugar transporter family protein [Arabidopsis lyrata subsp. lyrata]|uniref:Sugar transporter family protein n=1 Tax=Arabidopsis lyrata subsp. lyrata TaxID=81972 RepID=D7M1T7_ARALL|nr:sugar transporter family protein [Arabidopsis lyrata subsp. lyrata]
MAEEGFLLPASPNESSSSSFSSLVSEISNACTRPFVLAFTVGSCGAFAFGCIIGYSAPTQTSIMKDLNLSIADAIFTIWVDIDGGVNPWSINLWETIWITNILFLIGWFAIAFAKGVWLLDLGRLLQGISIGISVYLGPVYITEIAPRNLRGAASSFSQLFAGVGISVFYALGTVVTWRNLAILGSIPSLMVMPLLFFIPESPRWLAKVGREKEVEAVLLSLRGAKSDVTDETAEILEYTEHVKQQQDVDGGFFTLFQRKYAFSLTIGVVLIALPQLGGLNGYSFYTDSIFTSTGVSSDFGFISTSVVQMFGGILGTVLVDVSGRRFPSWNVLGLSCHSHFILLEGMLTIPSTPLNRNLILIFLNWTENHCWETGTPVLALISVMVYFGSYGSGMGSIPWIIASEIYPVDVKGAAGTMCNLVSSISSWLVAYSFSFLLQWSSTGTFLMFATVAGLGFVFIAKLVPETKGKSLEEIQSLFTDSPQDSTIL